MLGKKGQRHNESSVRTVHLPPLKSFSGWDISEYRDRWDLITETESLIPSSAGSESAARDRNAFYQKRRGHGSEACGQRGCR